VQSVDRVYVATWGGAGVYWTEDDHSWKASVDDPLPAPYIVSLAASGDKVYAGSYGWGLYYSEDAGEHWELGEGTEGRKVYSVAVSRESPEEVYAGTDDGVFFSKDGGKHWRQIGGLLSGRPVRALVFRKGDLYAGIDEGGVFRLGVMKEGLQPWIQCIGIDQKVNALASDKDGRLYVGTDTGVWAKGKDVPCETNSWELLPDNGSARVFALSVDADGQIRAGGENGLYLRLQPDLELRVSSCVFRANSPPCDPVVVFPLHPGDSISYTIYYKPVGLPIYNAVITSPIPSGLQFSGTDPQGREVGNNVRWEVTGPNGQTPLEPGTGRRVWFKALITPTGASELPTLTSTITIVNNDTHARWTLQNGKLGTSIGNRVVNPWSPTWIPVIINGS
jgi:hypothetical protein